MYDVMKLHASAAYALVTDDVSLTWQELIEESQRFAQYLHQTAPNTKHIGLLAKNSKNYIIAVHAIHILGKVLVPLNTRLTTHELLFQVSEADVDLLLVDEIADLPLPQLPLTDRSETGFISWYEWKTDDVMSLMFTSGTTGKPKAVQQTYGNHISSARAAQSRLGYDNSDRMLVVTPLFHMSGLAQVYRCALIGATLYVESKFDVARTIRLIESEQITQLSLVSVMLHRLLEAGLSRHQLRMLLVGGGPVPKPLLEEAERRNLPVAQTYGMTETCSQVATLLPEEALTHIGSSGRAISPTSIRISEDGEIEVNGPTVTPGYYKHPEADTWSNDGYWKTGDLGVIQDGYLYVQDRRSDLIISGGENVYPAEIEAALLRCNGVQDVGVTGLSDPVWGAVPVAFIVGKFNHDEVRHVLHAQLATYKHPKSIYSVEQLPRNANGKLMRHRLKELLP